MIGGREYINDILLNPPWKGIYIYIPGIYIYIHKRFSSANWVIYLPPLGQEPKRQPLEPFVGVFQDGSGSISTLELSTGNPRGTGFFARFCRTKDMWNQVETKMSSRYVCECV